MFTSKVCQRLCNLHEISIEKPVGPGVTWNERANVSVNRITAHIQRGDKCIHRRDFFKRRGRCTCLYLSQLISFPYMLFLWSFVSEPGFCELVSPKSRRDEGQNESSPPQSNYFCLEPQWKLVKTRLGTFCLQWIDGIEYGINGKLAYFSVQGSRICGMSSITI